MSATPETAPAPRGAGGGPLLAVENLRVGFATEDGRVQAVDGVNFELEPGEVLAIVGESGSGKSVTAQAVMGLTPVPPGEIRAGRIAFRGTDMVTADVGRLAKIRGEGISMIFQDPMTSLNPSMPIGKQIREVLHQHKVLPAAQSKARAVELLRLVGIPEPESRLVQYPHQFSGGMRQRIMIAIAIANNPDILLADDRQHLALAQREAHVAHRFDHARIGVEHHAEVLDRKDRFAHWRNLGSVASRSPSPISCSDSMVMVMAAPGKISI
jgi:ABC-type microcin C transport system duplicated ATPase subunit YejF